MKRNDIDVLDEKASFHTINTSQFKKKNAKINKIHTINTLRFFLIFVFFKAWWRGPSIEEGDMEDGTQREGKKRMRVRAWGGWSEMRE